MKHYIYVLKCSDNSLYTGYTNNIENRLKKHAAGKGSKYVRSKGSFTLVYKEEFKNKSDALKRELEIKALSRADKISSLHLSL